MRRAERPGAVRRQDRTAGLLEHDYRAEGEEPERVGERLALVDDDRARIAVIEVTAVEVVPFDSVTWEFADSEGEGYRSVEHWATSHRRFWNGLGYDVDDTTDVVCVSFRLAGSQGADVDPRGET